MAQVGKYASLASSPLMAEDIKPEEVLDYHKKLLPSPKEGLQRGICHFKDRYAFHDKQVLVIDGESMGSHHHQVAILVPDDKLDCFVLLEFIWLLAKNNLAIYLRPVLPLRTDGSPLTSIKLTCP